MDGEPLDRDALAVRLGAGELRNWNQRSKVGH